MSLRSSIAILLATAAAACGVPPQSAPDRTGTADSTLGERQGRFPNYGERAVMFLTNRARTEPSAFNDAKSYPPTPPLRWDLQLSKAARWQARHISEDGCWCADHSSCCRLERSGGEVRCANSPGACGQTSPEKRVSFWSSSYTGENAGRGYESPERAVQGWIHSPPHWRNINSSRHSKLGPGHQGTGWVQDFGSGASPPVVSSGIHLRGGGNPTFGLVYYQPGTGGPQTALLVLEGQCHELSLAYGNPDHGTFQTSATLQTGCNRYYFHVTDGRGNHHTYPSTGSLGVRGSAGGDCPLYRRTRPADSCSPTGESCSTGETRPCYTGPYGTEGVGICEAGSRRCIGGEWQETCRYQTHPKANEICGNGRDDDCNGSVDESCGTGDGPDAGTEQSSGTGSGPGPGCRQTGDGRRPLLPCLPAILLLAGRLRRRFRTHCRSCGDAPSAEATSDAC